MIFCKNGRVDLYGAIRYNILEDRIYKYQKKRGNYYGKSSSYI
ncbi:hypothetical protein RUMLAC_00298 [[Ruminococcus] lactaris ATCC 29176]|uniref:Uncharacterized protein n=1 Tax=[Ruminococcus] lactaris ATCC 29176 TaxID=471875 RepID=B5CLH7_9FIRM|nr:hypothetical protein RUMLAC_00298 [[Ruminococcus] lactaris ATCC 29176]